VSKHLDSIIKRLGYAESSCLKRGVDGYNSTDLTVHTIKVLNELSPHAVYMVDNEPFVMFFDEPSNQDAQKAIHKKIWNAQIPVAIFCGTADIKVFNGCTINKDTHLLPETEKLVFDIIDENSPFSFWEITNQNFWKDYATHFNDKKLNDALLDNLTYLTDRLKNTYNVTFATKLVLRLIFIRYLIDRGVDLDYKGFSSNVATSRSALLSLLDSGDDLYTLFAALKGKFNGNLFELNDENPSDVLTSAVLNELTDFMSANVHSPSGQLSFFDLYDFNIIPVELISNIYEILLGKEARNKDNAFYTPKYLADYILDMTITGHIENNDTCRVLDPACGSGVFLVDAYRRMIEKKLIDKKLNGEPYTNDDNLLCNTLTENIFGVDLNPDAIDVAVFSLYLAVLDYKNPKTLNQFQLPPLKGINLLECDFFNEDGLCALQEIPFDFIIGNPPWSNKHGRHNDYCKKYGYLKYLQNNDTCRSFILRSKDFIKGNPICCFVLHATMLYMQGEKSRKFRKEFLLSEAKIISVIELSSVRKLVFKHADAPAVILAYKFSEDNVSGNRFEHISMKPNIFFRLFNIIVAEKIDVKSVKQKLLKENDWAWKTLVYGLAGDIDNIMRLKKENLSVKEVLSAEIPALDSKTGVQYNDGDRNDASHLVGRDLLPSGAIEHFKINLTDLPKFEKSAIHRPRDERLFHAPYCLTLRGLDMDDYTMKSVYADVDFVFKEAVFAVKGSYEQRSLLLNLTGLFNSKTYAYFNLMIDSSLGIEREQRQAEEVLSFPFIFDENIAAQVEQIQEIKSQNDSFAVANDAFVEIDALNRTILEAFGLSDNEFVDYALRIQIPQLTRKHDRDATRNVTVQDFEAYGKYFYNHLSAVFSNASKHIQINVYPVIAKHYSAFEVLVLDAQPTERMTVIGIDADKQKRMLANLSEHKINDLFYQLKDVLFFEENSFYIIKPNYYKNWHPAIARLDLAEVTDKILSRNTGGNN
jgi:hypothetical protein